MFSLVRKTPKGMFWMGKSLFFAASNHDFLLVLLAVIGILMLIILLKITHQIYYNLTINQTFFCIFAT
jgi:hypothetical protein